MILKTNVLKKQTMYKLKNVSVTLKVRTERNGSMLCCVAT